MFPLGVGSHLDEWEIPDRRITELDWWESAEIGGLTIICTPAQHYSGRGIFDYKETFWSSWSIIGPKYRVFYSGDTGFSKHFQLIGNQLGPFDLGIIRIGQYGPGASWIYSNMDPEDAVRAHVAVQARRMLPVHWGTFNIAFHDWDEPIRRAVKAANERNVDLVAPRVGEVVIAGEPFGSHSWWGGGQVGCILAFAPVHSAISSSDTSRPSIERPLSIVGLGTVSGTSEIKLGSVRE